MHTFPSHYLFVICVGDIIVIDKIILVSDLYRWCLASEDHTLLVDLCITVSPGLQVPVPTNSQCQPSPEGNY